MTNHISLKDFQPLDEDFTDKLNNLFFIEKCEILSTIHSKTIKLNLFYNIILDYTLYARPNELKDIDYIASAIADILDMDKNKFGIYENVVSPVYIPNAVKIIFVQFI